MRYFGLRTTRSRVIVAITLVLVFGLVLGVVIGVVGPRRIVWNIAAGIGAGGAAVGALFGVRRWNRMRRELAELKQILEVTQGALVRPLPERHGSLRLAARYLAAHPRAQVGGDLYDAVDTPFGVRVIIGDVKGHGLAAVRVAADVLGAFRELAQREPSPAGVAHRLDAFLAGRNGRGGEDAAPAEGAGRAEATEESEEFVTALVVEVRHGTAAADLVCCGHPPPLALRDGRVVPLDTLPASLPLGLFGLGGRRPETATVPFADGDGLLLYTDGCTEARDPDGRFYPLAARAAAFPADDPGKFLACLEADLRAHGGGRRPQDDTALVFLRREPLLSAPVPEPPAPAESVRR
jgi:serine phosphatase RsbU (regulator of sigma subunit)